MASQIFVSENIAAITELHLVKTLSLKDTVKDDNKYSNKHRPMAL